MFNFKRIALHTIGTLPDSISQRIVLLEDLKALGEQRLVTNRETLHEINTLLADLYRFETRQRELQSELPGLFHGEGREK